MSREQIFVLDLGLAALSLLVLALFVVTESALGVYALKRHEDRELQRRVFSFLATCWRMTDPFLWGFIAAGSVAVFAFGERFTRLVGAAPWLVALPGAVCLAGLLSNLLVVQRLRRAVDRPYEHDPERGRGD